MKLKIYSSNSLQDQFNTYYPNEIIVDSIESAKKAFSKDCVFALYKFNQRSKDNFISSNVLPFDIDNKETDNPDEWITPKKIKEFFDGVPFLIHYSRNNNKQKGVKSPRPRFHLFFEINECFSSEQYFKFKSEVNKLFPYFDEGAMDNARLLYGTPNPEVELYEGDKTLEDFISESYLASFGKEIKEGERNTTMCKIGGQLIKRYGDTEEAYRLFLKESERCVPLLDDSELDSIWNSEKSFFKKISSDPSYISPEDYNSSKGNLIPEDFSDVGQAEIFSKEYRDVLRYSESTDYIVFNGINWEENKELAQGLAQKLTKRQLMFIKKTGKISEKELESSGTNKILEEDKNEIINPLDEEAYEEFKSSKKIKEFFKFVINRRNSKNITATLKEARPMLSVKQEDLDNKPFLLNTPKGTLDLRYGISSLRAHNSLDLLTKVTNCDFSDKGKDLFLETLNIIFTNDNDLIEYVQRIVGLCVIGKVYYEALIIAYGTGGNCKSTFWNLIARVLGTYSGSLSADTLTVGCKRNVKPELAETKGKRLIIASELQEGQRLNTATVKQLASTDEIFAEKKYKAPFRFTPSHTIVLYTNHLPRVGESDEGSWRRLIVIPFKAKIEKAKDIKNYADYLFDKCGEYCLKWIIEGAKKIYEDGYQLNPPDAVIEATKSYKENNDWLHIFLEECCELDEQEKSKSSEVYKAFRNHCLKNNEFVRSTTDFYTAIDNAGFVRKRDSSGKYIYGIKLKGDFDDFLS